jgi:prephenate dehydrogenase
METVAIVGVGLIGASFGLALRKAGFSGELIGVSSPPAIEAGLRTGAISRAVSIQQAAAADLIYLAQPIDRIVATIEVLGPLVRPGTLVTDAGSTKAAIVQKASECLFEGAFLGGHPLAGKEQRGAESADADLFRGRPYVLTPTAPNISAEAEFRCWLTRVGAKVLEITPSEHDSLVAFTSHMPQLVSTALSAALNAENRENLSKVFGPGLLDMTRLALSPPDLWMSILKTNQAEVAAALSAMISWLTHIRGLLGSEELGLIFESASSFARTIRNLDCAK